MERVAGCIPAEVAAPPLPDMMDDPVPPYVETIQPVLIVKAAVVAVARDESLTRIVTVRVSDAVGIPMIIPLLVPRVSPDGKVPDATENWFPPVPPLATICNEKEFPVTAVCVAGVVIESAAPWAGGVREVNAKKSATNARFLTANPLFILLV